MFAASTVAAGVLVIFLRLAVTTATATAALFAQAAAIIARWAAGRIGDRFGQARLLCPGVLLSAAGMALLAATGVPTVVVGGAACFGTGSGLRKAADHEIRRTAPLTDVVAKVLHLARLALDGHNTPEPRPG